MLASFPASMLNQKPSDLGILNRLKLDPSRSSLGLYQVQSGNALVTPLNNGLQQPERVGAIERIGKE